MQWQRGLELPKGPRAAEQEIPPHGYVCRLCNLPGHYISQCKRATCQKESQAMNKVICDHQRSPNALFDLWENRTKQTKPFSAHNYKTIVAFLCKTKSGFRNMMDNPRFTSLLDSLDQFRHVNRTEPGIDQNETQTLNGNGMSTIAHALIKIAPTHYTTACVVNTLAGDYAKVMHEAHMHKNSNDTERSIATILWCCAKATPGEGDGGIRLLTNVLKHQDTLRIAKMWMPRNVSQLMWSCTKLHIPDIVLCREIRDDIRLLFQNIDRLSGNFLYQNCDDQSIANITWAIGELGEKNGKCSCPLFVHDLMMDFGSDSRLSNENFWKHGNNVHLAQVMCGLSKIPDTFKQADVAFSEMLIRLVQKSFVNFNDLGQQKTMTCVTVLLALAGLGEIVGSRELLHHRKKLLNGPFLLVEQYLLSRHRIGMFGQDESACLAVGFATCKKLAVASKTFRYIAEENASSFIQRLNVAELDVVVSSVSDMNIPEMPATNLISSILRFCSNGRIPSDAWSCSTILRTCSHLGFHTFNSENMNLMHILWEKAWATGINDTRDLTNLNLVRHAVLIDCPDADAPMFQDSRTTETWNALRLIKPIYRARRTSQIQNYTKYLLDEMDDGTCYFKEEIMLDVHGQACDLEDSVAFLSLDFVDSMHQCAIEVNGPSHYLTVLEISDNFTAIGNPIGEKRAITEEILTGATQFKSRMLKKMGFTLFTVHYKSLQYGLGIHVLRKLANELRNEFDWLHELPKNIKSKGLQHYYRIVDSIKTGEIDDHQKEKETMWPRNVGQVGEVKEAGNEAGNEVDNEAGKGAENTVEVKHATTKGFEHVTANRNNWAKMATQKKIKPASDVAKHSVVSPKAEKECRMVRGTIGNNNILWKTQNCRHFHNTNGWCSRGDRCDFIHNETEPQLLRMRSKMNQKTKVLIPVVLIPVKKEQPMRVLGRRPSTERNKKKEEKHQPMRVLGKRPPTKEEKQIEKKDEERRNKEKQQQKTKQQAVNAELLLHFTLQKLLVLAVTKKHEADTAMASLLLEEEKKEAMAAKKATKRREKRRRKAERKKAKANKALKEKEAVVEREVVEEEPKMTVNMGEPPIEREPGIRNVDQHVARSQDDRQEVMEEKTNMTVPHISEPPIERESGNNNAEGFDMSSDIFVPTVRRHGITKEPHLVDEVPVVPVVLPVVPVVLPVVPVVLPVVH